MDHGAEQRSGQWITTEGKLCYRSQVSQGVREPGSPRAEFSRMVNGRRGHQGRDGEFMSNKINRRDFLSGTALAIAAGLTPLAQIRALPGRYYPPSLTGLRGSHPGSFETAHQVGREGRSFDYAGLAVEESYDLVVVGGGISGLAAAWFYREAHGPTARILILENHDDFGGHAKRNEFRVGDRLLLGYGGTESLQSPKTFFSNTVNRLLHALGVHVRRFDTAFDRKLYRLARLDSGGLLRSRVLWRGQVDRRRSHRDRRRFVRGQMLSPAESSRWSQSSRCREMPEHDSSSSSITRKITSPVSRRRRRSLT